MYIKPLRVLENTAGQELSDTKIKKQAKLNTIYVLRKNKLST
jgi:hypothetical protein